MAQARGQGKAGVPYRLGPCLRHEPWPVCPPRQARAAPLAERRRAAVGGGPSAPARSPCPRRAAGCAIPPGGAGLAALSLPRLPCTSQVLDCVVQHHIEQLVVALQDARHWWWVMGVMWGWGHVGVRGCMGWVRDEAAHCSWRPRFGPRRGRLMLWHDAAAARQPQLQRGSRSCSTCRCPSARGLGG
jgi:hypothetical protein